MREPTEVEWDSIYEEKDKFWETLGESVAKILIKFPEEIHGHILTELQESCSVYSTKYSECLLKLKEKKRKVRNAYDN